MKKSTTYLLLLLLMIGMASCRYDEGPYISFTNPEERLVGYWRLDEVHKNGTQLTSSDILAHNPGCFYSFFIERMVSVSALDANTMYESVYGTWEFQNREKELLISFVLRNKKYSYTAVIQKLTKQTLIYEFYDDYGDKWRFEFYNLSPM